MSMLPRFHPRHRLKPWPERRPFDPSLVAYYSGVLGSGSVLYDESIYGNHGAIEGPTWGTGKMRPALLYDGLDDYVLVAHHASLNPEVVSIEAWVYITLTTAAQMVVAKFGVAAATRQYVLAVYPQIPDTYLYIQGTTSLASVNSRECPTNQWIHLVGTYDRNRLRLYRDGLLKVTSGIFTQAINSTTVDMRLGMRSDGVSPLGGYIDEVRIYDRALSDAEILRDYLRLA